MIECACNICWMLHAKRSRFCMTNPVNSLETDRKLLLALVKDIEIVGEAASRLSPECQQTYAQLPWPQIVGMRNCLIRCIFRY